MMKFTALCALLAATASARPFFSIPEVGSPFAPTPAAADEGNVCNLYYTYCENDPGCAGYTCSVKSVQVEAPRYGRPVKAEDLKAGDEITLTVKGVTTMTAVPDAGSYRIYALDGKNVFAGALEDVFTLDGKNFELKTTFNLTDGVFNRPKQWLEFGLDVFQKSSGSDEGFCIEIEDIEYLSYLKTRPDPPFEMDCKDNGDGTFTPETTPLHGKPVPSLPCTEPGCSLHYGLCARDPGCVGYTMSVSNVVVDVYDRSGINAGDHILMIVNGTTTMTTIPSHGSYRVYDIQGHNAAAGALSNVFSLHDCVAEGCHFGMVVPFVLPETAFANNGTWMEFGLDVFQEASGSDEGVCIEVVNDAYLAYERNKPDPPFEQYCVDNGWGHYAKKTVPVVEHVATCVLE